MNTFIVIVMDQGMGPRPGQNWNEFLSGMKDGTFPYARFGRVQEVNETFEPHWGTVAYRCDEHGTTSLWKAHYDTSG